MIKNFHTSLNSASLLQQLCALIKTFFSSNIEQEMAKDAGEKNTASLILPNSQVIMFSHTRFKVNLHSVVA